MPGKTDITNTAIAKVYGVYWSLEPFTAKNTFLQLISTQEFFGNGNQEDSLRS